MKQKIKFRIGASYDGMGTYYDPPLIAVFCEAIIAEETVTLKVRFHEDERFPGPIRPITLPLGKCDQAALRKLRDMEPGGECVTKYHAETEDSPVMADPETRCNIVQNAAGFKVFITDCYEGWTIDAVLYVNDGPNPIRMEFNGGWSVSPLGSD